MHRPTTTDFQPSSLSSHALLFSVFYLLGDICTSQDKLFENNIIAKSYFVVLSGPNPSLHFLATNLKILTHETFT